LGGTDIPVGAGTDKNVCSTPNLGLANALAEELLKSGMRNLNFHADIGKIRLTTDRLLSDNQGNGEFLDRLDRKLSESLLAVGKFGALVLLDAFTWARGISPDIRGTFS
jgi:hypothetical protein